MQLVQAGASAQAGGYIQLQIDRLQAELAELRPQIDAEEQGIAGDNDKALAHVASEIASRACAACDAAIAASLQQARRRAWPAALSLAAPWGPGNPQVAAWFGLLLGALFVAGGFNGGPVAVIVVFLAGYGILVHWGHGRETLRSSQGERDAISEFRELRPMLVAFANEPSNDATHRYSGTHAPVARGKAYGSVFAVPEKPYGPQFGATFVGFADSSGKICMLARYAVDNFSPLAFPFNDLKDEDPRVAHWLPIASQLAAATPQYAIVIRNFAESIRKLHGLNERVRMITQRIETLVGQEKAWSDVAIPEETLDQILRLVDSFKIGRPLKGILLYGPPGTGKTLIARKLALHAGCNFIAVGISDLKGQHLGTTGPRVRELWQKCRAGAPTILFVDECESAFESRGSSSSDAFDEELVQTFLAEWDGFNQTSGQVFVIGATNRHDMIDSAIMSRFTETVEIGPPDAAGRLRILSNELAKAHLDFRPTEEMARECAGMSGRDIATLVQKIVATHLGAELNDAVFAAEVRKLRGKQSTSVATVDWDDLILPDATMAEFRSLGRELVHAEDLRKLGVDVPRGILLYGPPGTGKTQVARVLASESGLAFIAATSGDLKAGFIGQSGNQVKQLFAKARAQAPCILFIDEIDAVAVARGLGDSFNTEIVSQLLQELDGVATKKGQVFLLAASNHPDGIDAALLSRFERKIEIGLPDEAARAAILALQLAGKPVNFAIDAACSALAGQTAGKSGRDLQSLVTTATRRALQRAMNASGDPRTLVLTLEDLESALGRSVSERVS